MSITTNTTSYYSPKQSKGENREQSAAGSPEQGEEIFLFQLRVGELMVSASKLWPLAVGPIIHGGSPLPVLPSPSVHGKSSLHWKVNTFPFSAKGSLLRT